MPVLLSLNVCLGRFLPITIPSHDRLLLGESCRGNIANATVVCALIHKFLPLHKVQLLLSAMFSPLSHKYFLKVLAVMLILIANIIANGSTINTGWRLNGSAR